MTTRVSFRELQEYLAIIKTDFDVDIRLMKNDRAVTIVRYEAYEPNQPTVIRCKGNSEALARLKEIHADLFGC